MVGQAELYKDFSRGQYEAGMKLIRVLSLQPSEAVLDIGSGTGNLTVELAACVGEKGYVFAVEPDEERLAVAKKACPKNITQIEWFLGNLATASEFLQQRFDHAFSNYVFHWIEDQRQAVKQVYDVLNPGGSFAFNCGVGASPLMRELSVDAGVEQQIFSNLHLSSVEQWLLYFKDAGFVIRERLKMPGYYFESIDQAMLWWEATSQGVFRVDMLSQAQIEKYRQRFPGEVRILEDDTLSLLAVKVDSD